MRRIATLGSLKKVVRIGAIAIAATALLGGCNSDMKQRAAQLDQENTELRAQNEQLTSALSDSEAKRLAAESDLEKSRSGRGPGGTPGSRSASGDDGFGGIGGVTSHTQAGEVVVDIAGDVLFDSGKATLKSTAKKTLDSVAAVLNSRYSGKTIRVAGHTDSDPIKKSSWKTNERLSSERALAVEDYLATKGIPKNRMYAAAYGASQPKGSKKDSRRVEIVILAQGS